MLDRKIRRIYFWVLFTLFFATVIPIVFYAMGYRFSLERGIFVYTGSISIKSNPQIVDVAIDGIKNTSKKINRLNNSYHIGGIKPGEHLIEVTSADYQSWSKRIVVNSGTSAEFWNVLLVKNEYPRTDYGIENIKKFFLRPDSQLAACVSENGDQTSIKVLDFSNLTVEEIFSSNEFKFVYGKENIEWSQQGNKIIVPVTKDGGKNYLVIDAKTKELTDLKEVVGSDDINKVRWDPQNKDYFYYISENNLYRNDIQGDQKMLIASQISSYDLSAQFVYYFQLPSGIVYKYNPNSFSTPIQITTSGPQDMGNSNYKITAYDDERIAMLNEEGKLYMYNKHAPEQYFRKLGDNIEDVQFSDDGKKLLFWSNWEIFVYFTRDWEVQPWRNENEMKDVIRFSKEMKNIQWAKDYEHVLFTVDNKIKVTEIDNRGKRSTADVASISDYNNWTISDSFNTKLFFIDNSNLFSIDFPEKTGILGF